MFIALLPIGPLIGGAFGFANLATLRYTVFWNYRRNVPKFVRTIGAFQNCSEIMVYMTVATNMAVLFFVMRTEIFGTSVTVQNAPWLFLVSIIVIKDGFDLPVQLWIPDKCAWVSRLTPDTCVLVFESKRTESMDAV